MAAGWTAEVEIRADDSKVPDGPVEAAKFALDHVGRHLASAHVKVEHQAGGVIRTWLVDTSTGEVTTLREFHGEEPDREEQLAAPQESACEWAAAESHFDGLFAVVGEGYESDTITCGRHLADTISGLGRVSIEPYENGA